MVWQSSESKLRVWQIKKINDWKDVWLKIDGLETKLYLVVWILSGGWLADVCQYFQYFQSFPGLPVFRHFADEAWPAQSILKVKLISLCVSLGLWPVLVPLALKSLIFAWRLVMQNTVDWKIFSFSAIWWVFIPSNFCVTIEDFCAEVVSAGGLQCMLVKMGKLVWCDMCCAGGWRQKIWQA